MIGHWSPSIECMVGVVGCESCWVDCIHRLLFTLQNMVADNGLYLKNHGPSPWMVRCKTWSPTMVCNVQTMVRVARCVSSSREMPPPTVLFKVQNMVYNHAFCSASYGRSLCFAPYEQWSGLIYLKYKLRLEWLDVHGCRGGLGADYHRLWFALCK